MFILYLVILLIIKFVLNKDWGFSIFTAGIVSFIIYWASVIIINLYTAFSNVIFLGMIAGFIYYFFSDSRHIKEWLKHDYDKDIDIEDKLLDFAKNTQDLYRYDYSNIPIGRANAFIDGFDDLEPSDYIDIQYLGYNPIRSEDLMELKEYGVLATNKGLFLNYQEETKERDPEKNKEKTIYKTHPMFIEFSGLWSLNINESQKHTVFKYIDKSSKIVDLSKYRLDEEIISEIKELIDTGVTRNMLFEEEAIKLSEKQIESADSNIQDAYASLLKEQQIGMGIHQGYLASQVLPNDSGASLTNHMKDIQLNRVTTHTGQGEAAEYANSIGSKLQGNRVNTIGSGASNAEGPGQGVNAFDRTETNIFTNATQNIQTKYYRDQSTMASQVANKDYPPDTVFEVPRGKKYAAEEAFKRQGLDYKVIEGRISYETSLLIKKAGNIPSITVDLIDGAIQSTTGASISFIVAYAQARHLDLSPIEAAKQASITGLTTFGFGTVLYAGSQQFAKTEFSKTLANDLTKRLGREINAVDIAGYAGIAITGVIVYGPSVTDALRGRISPQQLFKNIAISTIGIIGAQIGAGIGKTIGTPLGPVGAILGGMTGSILTKKLLDQFVDDDSVEIYELYREEFIDYLYKVELNQDEIDDLINSTFTNKKFNRQLKSVYKAGRKYKGLEREYAQRMYIKEEILEPIFVSIFKERKTISSDEIEIAYNYAVSLTSESELHLA